MLRFSLFLCALLCLIPVQAKVFYENSFEGGLQTIGFYAWYGPKWISNLNQAKTDGYLELHRLGLSKQGEMPRNGVMSCVIDATLKKGNNKWGPSCMFQGAKLDIPLDRPVYLTAHLYPKLLPPDIHPIIAVLFTVTDPKTGKTTGGNLPLELRGVDPEGWLVFSEDVTALISKRFPNRNAVMIGYLVIIHSRKAFHGQHVILYLDDVSVKDTPTKIEVDKNGVVRGHDIVSRGPYEVNYLSYYSDVPKNAKNRAFNSSFELGFKDWFPMVQRLDPAGDDPQDPDTIFHVAKKTDAPHGGRVFEVTRNGKASNVALYSLPLKIRDGRDYTLSFYAKASKDTTLKVNYRSVAIGKQWKRYTIPFPGIKCYETWYHKNFPGRFRLMLSNRGDADLEFDAFQLEEGPLTAYRGFGNIGIAARPLAKYGLYRPGETPEFKVTLFNDAPEKCISIVRWQLKDFRRSVIAKGEKSVTLASGIGTDFTIDAPPGHRHYTLYLTLDSPGMPEQKTCVSASVVDDLRHLKGNEFFGASPLEGDNPTNLFQILDLDKRLGLDFIVNYHTAYQSRAPKDWRKHNPQWQKIENVLHLCKQYGFELLLTNYEPFPAAVPRDSKGGEHPTAENLKDVRDFNRELASRFKGRVKYFEVFAEYLKSPLEVRAAAADKVIRAAETGLKAGDPNAPLCCIGENKMNEGMLLPKMEALFKHGTLSHMDFLSLHPYRSGSRSFPGMMEKLRVLIRKYNGGKDKKIIGTESGKSSSDFLYYDDINGEALNYEFYTSELDQAESMVRGNLVLFGSGMFIGNALFYPYNGKCASRNSMYHFIITDNKIYPKVVFPAIANLVERLSGAKPAGEFNQRDRNGLQGYFFRRDGKIFAAVWIYATPERREKPAILALSPKELKAFNLVGEPVDLGTGTSTRLTLTGGPLYLYPNGIDDAAFLSAVRNIKVQDPTLTLRMNPRGTLDAEVFNDSQSELKGVLSFRPGTKTVSFRIPAGGKRVFTDGPIPRGKMEVCSAEMTTDQGNFRSNQLRPLACMYAKTPPEIDASLRDWAGVPAIRLGEKELVSIYNAKLHGPDDLGAEIRLQYDAKNLYLAVVVTDDVNRTPHVRPDMLWANDALQLQFVMSGDLKNSSAKNMQELAVGNTAEGPAVSVTYTMRDSTRNLDSIRRAIRRNGNRTIYELAIPWAFLQPGFRPDNSVFPGFNLAVSDNDGNLAVSDNPKLKGYEKSLRMAPGLVESKDPSTALQLFFLPAR